MRPFIAASLTTPALALALVPLLAGCDGCRGERQLSDAERTQALASGIRDSIPAPSASADPGESIGHAANVLPGQGPKRIAVDAPRMGTPMPILPGQGIGPIRFGATRQTIERLMGAPCDDANEQHCLYVGRAVEFKLTDGAVTEIRISRKGREAKKNAAGEILEFGFYNGALLPDLYLGMQPGAIQEFFGPPKKVEKIQPMGADGFAERHSYDGVTFEYDAWSNGKLVLGAAVLTKSDSAAAANDKALQALAKKQAEQAELAKKTRPTVKPR
jgi:hypothetical protein